MVKYILSAFLLLLIPFVASASVLGVQQGGTGSSSPSGILFGNDNGTPLSTLTIGSNLTLTGSTLSASGGGGSSLWPFTPSSYAGVANQSTTTPFWLKNTQIIASSTNFTVASTSALTILGGWWVPQTSSLLLTDANGKVGSASTQICTNQFIRSITGAFSATCATVQNTDLAHSTIVLNGTTLTLGDSADTITAASSTLLTDNNTFSGNNTFTGNAYFKGLVDSLLGFNQNGSRILYASSTNFDTFGGIGAGAGIVASATSSSLTSGSYSTAFGYDALNATCTGNCGFDNSAFGTNALESNTTGYDNVAMGTNALQSNTFGGLNTAVGYNALQHETGSGQNTAIGFSALTNTTGGNNTALGRNAGYSNTIGSNNLAVGFWSMFSNTTGAFNTMIGENAFFNENGSNNIGLGYNVASSSTSGNNNIAIGYDIALASTTGSNQLNIGNLIFGTGINGEGTNLSTGNVGIGTTTPGTLLSVGNTNGINFTIATSTFATTGGINLNSGCYAIAGTCISGGGGGASFGWPFTPSTNYGVAVQSTSTPEWFTAGMMASSTSYFVSASTTAASISKLYDDNVAAVGELPYVNGTNGYLIGNAGLTYSPSNLQISAQTTIPTYFSMSAVGENTHAEWQFSTGDSNAGSLGDLLLSNQFGPTNIMDIAYGGHIGISSTTPGTLLSLGSSSDFINFSNTATSTFAHGINLNGGCFSVNGTCISGGGSGTVTSVGVTGNNGVTVSGSPVTSSGTITLGLSGLANSVLANSTISGVSLGSNLGTLTISSPLTGTSYNGSTGVSVGCQTASGSQAGCLSSTDWTTFNNKGSGTVTSVAASVPSIFSISGSPITTSGTLAMTYSGTALPIANGGTGLTTVGASSTIAITNGTAIAWQKLDLGASVYGTLPIANGGTNATSFGTSNGILAYNGTSLVNFSGFTLTSSLLTATNASTTNLSVNGNEVSGERYPAWGYATSTTWTASSTVDLLAPFNNGTLSSIQCATDAGTLNVQVFVNSTAVTPMFNASTTKGTITFTGSNTFSKGDDISVQFGTPASSPYKVDCTGIATGA